MSGVNPAHIRGSVVNSIAHQSLRYLRQRAVDEYWAEQARALAEKREVDAKKPGKARIGALKRTTVSKSQIENAMFALLTEFKSLGKIETEWSPNENMPLPHPTGSKKQFAERAGIEIGHFELLEEGKIEFTLDDAIKIARASDIDLATFLTPSMENLESDMYLDLQPESLVHGPLLMFEWVLWIHGYRPLPGQNPKKFRETNALPKVFVNNPVDARRDRDIDERERELNRAKVSTLNALEALEDGVPKRSADVPLTPYEKASARYVLIPKTSRFMIRETLRFAARLKVLFRTDNGSSGLKILKKRFTDSLAYMRSRAVIIVKLLIGLGK
jgi:transcriptional regulator with XRE-family HTH domain